MSTYYENDDLDIFLDSEKTISPTKNKKNKKNKLTIVFD